MSTEAVYQYRHKKFDHRKRSREESYSSENETFSRSTESPVVSIRWSTWPNPKSTLKPERDLQIKMELINLNQETGNLSKRRLCHFESLPVNKNNARIKAEPHDTLKINYDTKIGHQTQSEDVLPVSAKEELIELNTSIPMIPREAYEEICKFRGNMVRKFPKKERSAKEQERRDKNTFACRRSRRVKKIEQIAIEEEYKGYKDSHLQMAEYAIRAAAYFKQLMTMTEASISDYIVVD